MFSELCQPPVQYYITADRSASIINTVGSSVGRCAYSHFIGKRGLGSEEYKLALQRTQVQQTEGLRSGVHTGCVPAKFKPNLFTVSITFLVLLRISEN